MNEMKTASGECRSAQRHRRAERILALAARAPHQECYSYIAAARSSAATRWGDDAGGRRSRRCPPSDGRDARGHADFAACLTSTFFRPQVDPGFSSANRCPRRHPHRYRRPASLRRPAARRRTSRSRTSTATEHSLRSHSQGHISSDVLAGPLPGLPRLVSKRSDSLQGVRRQGHLLHGRGLHGHPGFDRAVGEGDGIRIRCCSTRRALSSAPTARHPTRASSSTPTGIIRYRGPVGGVQKALRLLNRRLRRPDGRSATLAAVCGSCSR